MFISFKSFIKKDFPLPTVFGGGLAVDSGWQDKTAMETIGGVIPQATTVYCGTAGNSYSVSGDDLSKIYL